MSQIELGYRKETQLSPEAREYLREVFQVCRYQAHCLSIGGMSHGRSRLSVVNELTIDTLRVVVGNDDFLYQDPETPLEYTSDIDFYFRELQKNLDGGGKCAPEAVLTSEQKTYLTRLAVVLEWGWAVANEVAQGGWTYSDSPKGRAVKIVKDMLAPFIDKDEAELFFNLVKDNNGRLELFVRSLQWDVKDFLYPVPPDLQEKINGELRDLRQKRKRG